MDAESTQIREFIEKLVEALVSGQLDDVKVNRLYTHPEFFCKLCKTDKQVENVGKHDLTSERAERKKVACIQHNR
ncbi:hypothetical protein C0J52_18489 [Blattella germanica]|nr:hypothetical protein C0J52_18489 [Blattella germanica]